jgi:hypothetical protein
MGEEWGAEGDKGVEETDATEMGGTTVQGLTAAVGVVATGLG